MNGSPLFTGGAASGKSEIRRWMLENDWVEAIIALPTDIFYNTGIQTYVWILANRKPVDRRGRVQLIDGSGKRYWRSMRKSLGSKRREITDDARAEIVRIYGEYLNGNAGYGDVSENLPHHRFRLPRDPGGTPIALAVRGHGRGADRAGPRQGYGKADRH